MSGCPVDVAGGRRCHDDDGDGDDEVPLFPTYVFPTT